MENKPLDARKELLRLGQAILITDFAVIGWAFLWPLAVSYLCAVFAAVMAVVLLAKSADRSLPDVTENAAASESVPRAAFRFQMSLGTMLLFVTVTAVFLGLGKWNSYSYCNVAFMVYVYGFPFRCVVTTHNGTILGFDFLCLASDIAIAISLVVGIAFEMEYFRNRRGASG